VPASARSKAAENLVATGTCAIFWKIRRKASYLRGRDPATAAVFPSRSAVAIRESDASDEPEELHQPALRLKVN
jgi:hypothetical protein